MRDTWHCRRYPGGLPVGVARDTWRNRSVPGNSTRETRVALGGFRGISFAKLAAHSEASGRVLSVGYSGHVAYSHSTRRILSAWHSVWAFPGHVERSGVIQRVLSAWVSGTRGALARHPGGLSRLRHSGQGLSRNFPGNTLSVVHSGHGALA